MTPRSAAIVFTFCAATALAQDSRVDAGVRTVLTTKLGFSTGELTELSQGRTVKHGLQARAQGEIAVAGAVRIRASKTAFFARVRDIERFKSGEGVLQIGRFSSPPNPADLDRLSAMCATRDIAIVADEVFADYELEPGAAGRAGRVTKREDVLSFALGGLSKSVGLPQVKLGWMAVGGPDRLVSDALERLELVCDTYLAVSTPAQLAAEELLVRGAIVRAQIRERVAANYRALKMAVAGVPSCGVLPGEGGWYAVLRVPSLESEEDLVVRLVADGVLTHPGYFFDFPRESYLIVSLLPSEPAFADGVIRVLRHFDCKASRP